MKGIILAGGSGTRLYPVTQVVSKQLLPIFDKPMIYYPLSVLMLAQIQEILIISTPNDIPLYKNLLGDGSRFGIKLDYAIQAEPNGLAEAFILGEQFIGQDCVSLILGDNFLYGHDYVEFLMSCKSQVEEHGGGMIFGYKVKDPENYGVVELGTNGELVSIEEKPQNPKSSYAVIGHYFFDNKVIELAKQVKPTHRGELEITSINQAYLELGELQLKVMGRGFTWLDTGTHENLLEASVYVKTIENRQGLKIACLEEIAYEKGWISAGTLLEQGTKLSNSSYGEFLLKLYHDELN
jgi:glucose-1-phosphate thymidylyltransferase